MLVFMDVRPHLLHYLLVFMLVPRYSAGGRGTTV